MDKEYLENIAGSSYINEGLGDKLMAKSRSGFQRFSSLAGGQMSDLNYTKIESLYKVFNSKIEKLLRPFAEGNNSVSNRIKTMRPTPGPEVIKTTNDLIDLYRTIVPVPLTSPSIGKVNTTTSQSNLSGIVKENFFSNEIAVNSAIQSNNPTKIVDTYKNIIKKEYSNFLNDSKKLTNTSTNDINKIVGSINPNWKRTINKMVTMFPELVAQTLPDPALSQPKPETASNTVSSNSVSTPTNQKSPVDKSNEFGEIVLRTMDIIIKTVADDYERSNTFTQKTLPTDWNSPAITKESVKNNVTDDEDDNDESMDTGEFLYKFHSKYRKYPGGFSVDVKPSDSSLNTLNDKKIDVVWNWDSHVNNIYIKTSTVGATDAKTLDVLLFKFYDDQVNPRTKSGQNFNIDILLDQANQNSSALLGNASPELKKSLYERQEPLLRSLYATVNRKAMEFKRKTISFEVGNNGELFQKKNGLSVPVPKSKIFAALNSSNEKERQRWIDSLEKIGYFKANPAMIPKKQHDIANIPEAEKAIQALMALGEKQGDALQYIQKAIDTVGTKATEQEYIKAALKLKEKPTIPVSAPVSNTPTAPVSVEKPKPETSNSKSELGSASFDNNGVITWTKPDGQVRKYTVSQLKNRSIPRLEDLLSKQGYFDKFPAASKEKVNEDIVNPFQMINFI